MRGAEEPTEARTGRAICPRCGRPEIVCYCDAVERLDTKTRVVILQHPRERHVRINTARIARLCLPNSSLHQGVDFSDDEQVRAALTDPARPAALLFPGERAIDVRATPPKGPVTLVVLDGTWWQAAKLLKSNPALAALPRYAIAPEQPSRYRIRRQPADHCLATIEVLAEVLGVLEGDAERLSRLLAPFDAMVDKQLAWIAKNDGSQRRHQPRRKPPARGLLPRPLLDRPESIVYACGETNAWPRDATPAPSEIVHFVALRPATGERFEAFVRTEHPLGPSTSVHVELPREVLEAGEPFASFAARLREFLGDDAALVMWGHHAGDVIERHGLAFPRRLDLRRTTIDVLGGRAGEIEACAGALGVEMAAPLGRGRAFRRLAALVAIGAELAERSRARLEAAPQREGQAPRA